ncbi:hypothetical protein ONZ45_g7084 [Pleurotus djamor]|nr:hypothetical protein ONZ45_g7084 [Pleurotus djamor]
MVARVSAFAVVALPVLAAATAIPRDGADTCSSGDVQCCNSLQQSTPTLTSLLGGLLGLVLPNIDGLIGLNCIGLLGGSSCNSQAVCCSNNQFEFNVCGQIHRSDAVTYPLTITLRLTRSLPCNPSPAMHSQIETELSLLYRTLRLVVKPFRPRLVKPKGVFPGGSPRLTKRPKSKNNCEIVERLQDELWCYDFVPRMNSPPTSGVKTARTNRPNHRIYYFAGGGFRSPPSGEHWSFVSLLASRPEISAQYDFTLVSYPLAPHSPASYSLLKLYRFLKEAIDNAARSGQQISLMGDSAGGNIVLSLGFWFATELAKSAGEGVCQNDSPEGDTSLTTLKNLIVISPPCDHRNVTPSIKLVDRLDPILGYDMIEASSKAWSACIPTSGKFIPRSDPSISPKLQPKEGFDAIKDAEIRVHGIVGTHDVLAPDALQFMDKCSAAGIRGEWLIWEEQMHCFPLAGVYGLKEGKVAMRWIADVLTSSYVA